MAIVTQSYRATSVTLPDHTKSYNLADLLTAVDPAFPTTGREVTIQNDLSVVGVLSVGDSTVTSSLKGYSLQSGDSRTYRNDVSTVPGPSIFLNGSVDNMVVNVEVSQ
jgi:hypothetical protein